MKMFQQEILLISSLFMASLMIRKTATHECYETHSIYQRMSKRHTFKMFNARPGSVQNAARRAILTSDVKALAISYSTTYVS